MIKKLSIIKKHKFLKFIKAVGSGKKHNSDLSEAEMIEATDMILKREISNEEISAFLLGWRVKPETVDEFKGVVQSFDKYIIKKNIPNSIELGYPYDGKKNNPYLFTLIAKTLKKYDINIIITGDKLQPAKNGITAKDIINNYDIKDIDNLHFFDRENCFKELSNLTDIRNRLGIRTGLNTVERLLNPANSEYALIGVFHKPFMQKYVDIFAERYKRFTIVKGNEGTAEIFSKTQFWTIENQKVQEYKIDPKKFGINYNKSWERISLEESINLISNPDDEFMKLVNLNSALILYIFGKVKTIEDGYEILK